MTQPGNFFVVIAFGGVLAAFLVTPVCRHAEFGMTVHLPGANLHFQRTPVGTAHRRMQGTVVVALGIRDVVVKLLGNRRPEVVHQPQRGIAILDLIDDHPQGAHVVNLGKGHTLFAHLVPDAVNVLGTTINLGLPDTQRFQLLAQADNRIGDELFALDALFVELAGNLFIGLGMQEVEGAILQLPLQFPDAETIGQR